MYLSGYALSKNISIFPFAGILLTLSFCLIAAIDEIVILNSINTDAMLAIIFTLWVLTNSSIFGINGFIYEVYSKPANPQ